MADASDTQYFGSRMRAILTPPATGQYEFYLVADDSAELLLSTDGSPANARQIALVERWMDERDYTCETSRAESCAVNQIRSGPIQLEAGKRYYVEVNHVESVGADHASVAWTLPGSDVIVPIPASSLRPPGD